MTVKVYSPVLPSVELFGAFEGIASATGANQTVSLTFTPTNGTLFIVPYGDTVTEVQLEEGSTATAYQRVVSEFDVTEVGVPSLSYISYNGVNTAYSTPALPAPLVDKAQVFAGASVLVPRSNNSPIIQIGDTTTSSTDALLRLVTGDGSTDGYRAVMFGSGANTTARVPKVTPYSAQFTVLFDAAQTGAGEISLREDGLVTSTGSATDSGLTAFGSQQIFFGAIHNNTAFFNGRHYDTLGPITRFSATNATTEQIEAAEAYYTARVI